MDRLEKSWIVSGTADNIVGEACPANDGGSRTVSLWVRSVSLAFSEPRERDGFVVLNGRDMTVLEVIRVPKGTITMQHQVRN